MQRIYNDQTPTPILGTTDTTADIEVMQAGLYAVIVKGQASDATLAIAAVIGTDVVTVDSIANTDLLADGSDFSGLSQTRLGPGIWRITPSAAGVKAWIAAAGQ